MAKLGSIFIIWLLHKLHFILMRSSGSQYRAVFMPDPSRQKDQIWPKQQIKIRIEHEGVYCERRYSNEGKLLLFCPMLPATLLIRETQAGPRSHTVSAAEWNHGCVRFHAVLLWFTNTTEVSPATKTLSAAAAVSCDAVDVPHPGRGPPEDRASPSRQSSSGRPGWSQTPQRTAAQERLCPVRAVCYTQRRITAVIWGNLFWQPVMVKWCFKASPVSSHLLWLNDRWAGRGRIICMGAPSFSLPSSTTSCSSGLLRADTSLHWRTAKDRTQCVCVCV